MVHDAGQPPGGGVVGAIPELGHSMRAWMDTVCIGAN